MDELEFIEIKEKLAKEIKITKSKVSQYTELSKPIEPENAIGRVSRMDAINNKSIVEAALREAQHKLNQLETIEKKLMILILVNAGSANRIYLLGD